MFRNQLNFIVSAALSLGLTQSAQAECWKEAIIATRKPHSFRVVEKSANRLDKYDVAAILRKEPNPNVIYKGQTLLSFARANSPEIVQPLLLAGARIDFEGPSTREVFHYSISDRDPKRTFAREYFKRGGQFECLSLQDRQALVANSRSILEDMIRGNYNDQPDLSFVKFFWSEVLTRYDVTGTGLSNELLTPLSSQGVDFKNERELFASLLTAHLQSKNISISQVDHALASLIEQKKIDASMLPRTPGYLSYRLYRLAADTQAKPLYEGELAALTKEPLSVESRRQFFARIASTGYIRPDASEWVLSVLKEQSPEVLILLAYAGFDPYVRSGVTLTDLEIIEGTKSLLNGLEVIERQDASSTAATEKMFRSLAINRRLPSHTLEAIFNRFPIVAPEPKLDLAKALFGEINAPYGFGQVVAGAGYHDTSTLAAFGKWLGGLSALEGQLDFGGVMPFLERHYRGYYAENTQLITHALEVGAIQIAQDENGQTVFHRAAASNYRFQLQVRQIKTIDPRAVNLVDHAGNTPLHAVLSLTNASTLILKLLVAGADPCIANKDGNTPEMMAKQSPDAEVLRIVVSGGFNCKPPCP